MQRSSGESECPFDRDNDDKSPEDLSRKRPMPCENCNKWMRLLIDFIGQVERSFGVKVLNEAGGREAQKDPAFLVTESMTGMIAQFRGTLCPSSWDLSRCGDLIQRFGPDKVQHAMEVSLDAGARNWKYVERVCESADSRVDTRRAKPAKDDDLKTLEDQAESVF